MTDQRLTVLYLTGWCRSGTTLIGNILGELPGAVHVGELRYLWLNGVAGAGTNNRCGCGAVLTECPLWSEVLTRSDAERLAPELIARQRDCLRTRHTAARLAEATGRRTTAQPAAQALADLVRLYRTIAEVSGSNIIIDSGKFPAEAAAICGSTELDARILHVVRDPRATAESWRSAKEYIPAMGVARSTLYWVGFNHASAQIGAQFPDRCQRIGYEQFVAAPRQVLGEVLDRWQLAGDPGVSADGRVTLGVNHTVTGNPDRLRRGEVQIRPDDRWLHTQPAPARLAASALAAPWLRRYGYHWQPAGHRAPATQARS